MRIVIAAVLGGIVMFLWQFVAHTMLPVGEMGVHQPRDEDVVLQAVSQGLPESGIYMLPSIESSKMYDEAVASAWIEKAKTHPFAYVVVSPSSGDPTAMGLQLARQFVVNVLAALLVAWLLAAIPVGFGGRVAGSVGLGVFGWLANVVPQWNWYRFPVDYVFGGLIEQGVGWLLAGLAIAWWLGRR